MKKNNNNEKTEKKVSKKETNKETNAIKNETSAKFQEEITQETEEAKKPDIALVNEFDLKEELEQGWENEFSSIRFWSFVNRPVFIGRLHDAHITIQSKRKNENDSEVYLFIEESTQIPFYINQYTAIKKTLEKIKTLPDENGELTEMKIKDCKNIIFKIQYVQEHLIEGGKKFKEFNILTKVE